MLKNIPLKVAPLLERWAAQIGIPPTPTGKNQADHLITTALQCLNFLKDPMTGRFLVAAGVDVGRLRSALKGGQGFDVKRLRSLVDLLESREGRAALSALAVFHPLTAGQPPDLGHGVSVSIPEDPYSDGAAIVLGNLDRCIGQFREAMRGLDKRDAEAIGRLVVHTFGELGISDYDLGYALRGILRERGVPDDDRSAFIASIRERKFTDLVSHLSSLVEARQLKKEQVDEAILEIIDKLKAKGLREIKPLLAKLGELGVFAGDLSEAHGGLESTYASEARIVERFGGLDALQFIVMTAIGVGRKPIEWKGSPEQVERYMTRLAAGEIVAGFAFVEMDNDPNPASMKTNATRLPNGKWMLNGTKAFVTNAGIASVFVIFAKTYDVIGKYQGITAFLVDANTPGVQLWQEHPNPYRLEGMSIRPIDLHKVVLDDEKRLGEVGEGLVIAYSALNVGRWRLAGSAAANLIHHVHLMVGDYKVREGSGQLPAALTMMPRLTAETAVSAFVVQSTVYRLAGDIDREIAALGDRKSGDTIMLKWHEAFVEAAITKVLASESYSRTAREVLQAYGDDGIMGGNYAERTDRDAAFTETHLGANPLLRHLIVKGMLGRLEKPGTPDIDLPDLPKNHPLSNVVLFARRSKALVTYCYRLILEDPKLKKKLVSSKTGGMDSPLAELAIGAYAIDSVVRRALKVTEKDGEEGSQIFQEIANVFARREFRHLIGEAKKFANNLAGQRQVRWPLAKKFIDAIEEDGVFDEDSALDRIGAHMINKGGYSLFC